MTTKTKKNIAKVISDYQIWIAAIEQYLEDYRINKKKIINQLNSVKKQLSQLAKLKSILDIHQQIAHIDQTLQKIQTQLIISPVYSS
ncbi:hypothetical protein KJ855_02110 [Patescibacteria group bacterium]|nr:hypothetical protein [Patescibacteria group bacterium]